MANRVELQNFYKGYFLKEQSCISLFALLADKAWQGGWQFSRLPTAAITRNADAITG
jgi:hypothetical protein